MRTARRKFFARRARLTFRLMNVGAILKNHDPSQIVGVPVKAWIDEQKRGNLAMRWGTTETALQAKRRR